MPSLGTLLADGNGSGPRNWNTQAFGDIDEGISAADGNAATGNNNNNNEDTSFTMQDTPADLGNVDTLSWQVRYRQQGRSDDTIGLEIRVMSGAIVLAAGTSGGAFQIVDGNITTTTFTNSSVTAFSYVNTGASKAQWDAMEVELRQTHSQSMGPDGVHVEVDTFELTGNYTAAAAGGSKFLPSLGF